jgi:hypothetical protein
MTRRNKPTKARLKRVSVRAERRSEPDWDKFAYALLQFVKAQSAQNDKATKPKRKPKSP